VPLIGTWFAFLIFGGEFPAHEIISRLFVIHIMLVPALIIGLLGAHLAILWRQKHTQFPEAGRTESNVVGSKLWPTYAAKSVGLFCAVFAVLGALGGLAQINPIWLYGPFDPAFVASPSQPDWFLGWVDGALRLFPAWEFRTGSFMIPNPFFPAVLMPGVTFGLLYLWPFLEARFTGDYGPHELLDRPTDRPARSAIGAGVLTFYIVLLFAASNDVLARMFQVPVLAMTVAFRVALFVIPSLVAFVVYRWFKAVKVSGAEGVMEVSLEQVLHPTPGGSHE
jgi:ubiquinol-cytochrome c reductase cytochrome b subunit